MKNSVVLVGLFLAVAGFSNLASSNNDLLKKSGTSVASSSGQKYKIVSVSGPECWLDLPSGFVDDTGHSSNVGDVVTISFGQGGVSLTNSNPSPTTEDLDVGTVHFGGEISVTTEGKFLSNDTFQLKYTDNMSGGSETTTISRSGDTLTTEIVFNYVTGGQVFSSCVLSAVN